MSKVIVIDDMKSYCDSVCATLADFGIEAVACQTVKKAKWLIERAGRNDVILADLMLNDESGKNGTDILRWMREQRYHQLFFLMTNYGTMENSIETMELGAKSYIPKQQMDEKFYAKIKGIMEEQNLRDKHKNRLMFRRNSQPFLALYERLKGYVGLDLRLVVVGESGTGRSHLAEDYMAMEGFHYGDYAHVRCSALAEMEHVEDYFFGHQKGAYASAVQSIDGILEKARDSFLFLENVDEMPLSVQNLLKEVLETGEYCRIGSCKKRIVDYRLICTSAKSPDELVREGLMTQHFRDCICEEVVNIPPLRETVTDIVPMATFFLEHFDERRRLSSKAKHKLEAYPWPGNVRELVRVIEQAIKKYDCDKLQPEHLTFSLQEVSETPTTMKLNDESEEKTKIVKALESCGYRREPAAAILGISRRNLFQKMKDYCIEVPKHRNNQK